VPAPRLGGVSERFILTPRGPFSLRAATRFGFGPYTERTQSSGEAMRLAFPVDGCAGHAGVVLLQEADDGPVHVELQGDGDPVVVRRQVQRILSLDHDGEQFVAIGATDPVLGELQRAHPGQRPVLFHSPYEAAAWSIIAVRRHRAQATRTREELAQRFGRVFELDGQRVAAFPQPERLLTLDSLVGLGEDRLSRLHGVARAALEGRLEASRLQGLGAEAALQEVLGLRGIGPFYAGLIVVRATGFADAMLAVAEPKLLRHAAALYGAPEPLSLADFTALAERWRPFRTWATVLVRLAGERAAAS
jgi:DNA-3-methyladenine glycosylase II